MRRLRLVPLLVVFMFVLGAPRAEDPPSSMRIVPEDEPGKPLLVVGTVRARGSGRPVAGARIHVYHTDAQGYYSPGGQDDSNPRLAGDLQTDANGRFELRTIRPGSYYNMRSTQHIHYTIRAEGYDRVVGEILFADDPFLPEGAGEEEGIVIVSPEPGESGVLVCKAVLWVGEG